MALVLRNYEQILLDMVTHVQANTSLTDFTVGSVIRTILEAASLEDDEQYYQMAQLLEAFRVQTARGTDLDERAADYNLTRLPASRAFGRVKYTNEALITDFLVFTEAAGSLSIVLIDSSDFPSPPPNYDIRIGEGTANVEDVQCTANNPATNTLTVGALVNTHDPGERVSVIGSGTKVVNAGVQPQVPAQAGNGEVIFTSLEAGTIVDGNYESALVSVQCNEAGALGTVGATRISQFAGSPPFVGASVTNPSSTSGGRDVESDDDFRARLLNKLDELARGTPQAIESSAVGVEDTQTGQRTAYAKLREDWIDPFNHNLYIDDGTGFTPTLNIMAKTTLVGAHGGGVLVLNVDNAGIFPASGGLIVGPGTASVEYLEYSSKGAGNTINLIVATGPIGFAGGEEVILVDNLGVAEAGQNFFRTVERSIQENSFELYDDNTGIILVRPESEYAINRPLGEIQYAGVGLYEGTNVYASYSYYTGLLAEVQKVISGDLDDKLNYPGVAAGGIIINVKTPTIRRITVTVTISAKEGFDETSLKSSVEEAIETYINSRSIGSNIFIAKIIEEVMGLDGILNVSVQEPFSDLIILENELPTPYDSNGNLLVTVL